MRLTFRHTVRDVLELNRSLREQRIKGYLVTLMGVALLLVGAWIAAFRESNPRPATAFIFGTGFILLGVFATRLAGIGAWILKSQRTPYEIEIGQEGVAFLEGHEQALVRWQTFSRWYETTNRVVLVAPADALAIPKRSCGQAECQALRVLVQSSLGSPARW